MKKRNANQLSKVSQSATTFNLDQYTVGYTKSNSIIDSEWIVKIKMFLFAKNTTNLIE